MATTPGNLEALRRALAQYFPSRPSLLRPGQEAVRVIQVDSGSGLNKMHHWAGYELHLLREGTTPGNWVHVAMTRDAAASRLTIASANGSRRRPSSMILMPGQYIRCEQGFESVWLCGDAGAPEHSTELGGVQVHYCFAVVTDPLFRYREGRVLERRYIELGADAPAGGNVGLPVGPEWEYVTLFFTATGDRSAPYSGAASDFTVHWYLDTGHWAHTPTDDFISGQLEQVAPTNNGKSFAVPPGARRLYVRQTGAVAAGLWVHYVGGSDR